MATVSLNEMKTKLNTHSESIINCKTVRIKLFQCYFGSLFQIIATQ